MENLHVIRVDYLQPTNTKPLRAKLTSDMFNEKVIIPIKVGYGAISYLLSKGLNIIGSDLSGRYVDYYISDTFKSIK